MSTGSLPPNPPKI